MLLGTLRNTLRKKNWHRASMIIKNIHTNVTECHISLGTWSTYYRETWFKSLIGSKWNQSWIRYFLISLCHIGRMQYIQGIRRLLLRARDSAHLIFYRRSNEIYDVTRVSYTLKFMLTNFHVKVVDTKETEYRQHI